MARGSGPRQPERQRREQRRQALRTTAEHAPRIDSFLAGDGLSVWSGVTVDTASGLVSTDLRGAGGVPSKARGVLAMMNVGSTSVTRTLYIDSADAPGASDGSPRHRTDTNRTTTGHYIVPLGTGENAGKIRLSRAPGDAGTDGVSVWITGWWT